MKVKAVCSILCLFALVLVLAACDAGLALGPTPTSTLTSTPIATNPPANTLTYTPTATPTYTPTAAPTSTATPTTMPTSKPTVSPTLTRTTASTFTPLFDLKPGTWKGELNGVITGFQITKMGQFGLFVIIVPDKSNLGSAHTCYLEVENTKNIEIGKDGKFIANKAVDVESLYKNLTASQANLVKQFSPTPIATETSDGKLVDISYVSGMFTSSTSAQGTFSVMECKGISEGTGTMRFSPITGTWKADWASDTP